MKTLFIDNYDSFTFNLVQALATMGTEVEVCRNDDLSLGEVERMCPDRIVISPGPKRPEDAGMSCQIIEQFGPHVPLLGVCLGMQCINEVFGGRTVKASLCVHGKTSAVHHTGTGLYRDVPDPFQGARYHSLVVDQIPACLEMEAWTEDAIPMGIRHVSHPIVGVQFHPESFMTEPGERILEHFLEGDF
jgi:anthranilate synthase/aminodeoxychorismate synthase-like glutamine amidotransferase